MEHTKKLVLVDPRFSRPTMKDKVLSGLDNDISSILNSDASDEAKAYSYMSALSRFKAISSPPRGPTPGTQPQAAVAAVPAVPAVPRQPKAASVSYKMRKPPKRLHKPKLSALDDPSFCRRELRTPSKRNLGTQWTSLGDTPVKRKKKQTGSGHGIVYRPFSCWEL